MRHSDLYVIAAGIGSRLSSNVPKALYPISTEPCLTTTLRQIGCLFRRIFVVTNVLVNSQWCIYFKQLGAQYPSLVESVVHLPIHSGLGDGHATLQAFIAAENFESAALSADVVILWGDVFVPDSSLFDELLDFHRDAPGLIPAVYESNPYVTLVVDETMKCVAAEFSKHGEQNSAGFHDQCVFRFDRDRLKESLRAIHCALWKRDRYIAPGGELSLLYTFHQLHNSNNPARVYETSYRTLTFNTIEEVASIQRQVDSRKTHDELLRTAKAG